jgi:hypothetical protein
MSRLRIPKENPPSCGIAAICALTGMEPAAAVEALRSVAKAHNRDFKDDLRSFMREDVIETLMSLGVKLFAPNGVELKLRNIHFPRLNPDQRQGKPSIRAFISTNEQADVLIGIAYTEDLNDVSHTFVVDGQRYYDHNTNGKIVGPADVPDDGLERYHVCVWYRVRTSGVDGVLPAAINKRTDDIG